MTASPPADARSAQSGRRPSRPPRGRGAATPAPRPERGPPSVGRQESEGFAGKTDRGVAGGNNTTICMRRDEECILRRGLGQHGTELPPRDYRREGVVFSRPCWRPSRCRSRSGARSSSPPRPHARDRLRREPGGSGTSAAPIRSPSTSPRSASSTCLGARPRGGESSWTALSSSSMARGRDRRRGARRSAGEVRSRGSPPRGPQPGSSRGARGLGGILFSIRIGTAAPVVVGDGEWTRSRRDPSAAGRPRWWIAAAAPMGLPEYAASEWIRGGLCLLRNFLHVLNEHAYNQSDMSDASSDLLDQRVAFLASWSAHPRPPSGERSP